MIIMHVNSDNNGKTYLFQNCVFTLVLSQTIKRFVIISTIFFMNKVVHSVYQRCSLNATDVFVVM